MNTIKDNFYISYKDDPEDFTMIAASDNMLYFVEIGQPIRKFLEVKQEYSNLFKELPLTLLNEGV